MVIYEPKGKAGEYAPWAVNLYSGCGHGCTYCYAPSAIRMDRQKFYSHPSPRKDILARLEKNATKMAGIVPQVLLSFTSDPYQPIEADQKVTRRAIEILKGNGININILTKGGKLSTRDFDLLDHKDKYGITLTCLDGQLSRRWEPWAPLPEERIAALREAKQRGIGTWVSLEPVIDQDTPLEIIDRIAPIVGMWKVGKMNYHPIAKTLDWKVFARNVRGRLDDYKANYILKEDLKAYL